MNPVLSLDIVTAVARSVVKDSGGILYSVMYWPYIVDSNLCWSVCFHCLWVAFLQSVARSSYGILIDVTVSRFVAFLAALSAISLPVICT